VPRVHDLDRRGVLQGPGSPDLRIQPAADCPRVVPQRNHHAVLHGQSGGSPTAIRRWTAANFGRWWHGSVWLPLVARRRVRAVRGKKPVLMMQNGAPSTRSLKPLEVPSQLCLLRKQRRREPCGYSAASLRHRSNNRQPLCGRNADCNVGGASNTCKPSAGLNFSGCIGYYQLNKPWIRAHERSLIPPKVPGLQRHQRRNPQPAPQPMKSSRSSTTRPYHRDSRRRCARGSIAVVCHAPGRTSSNKKFGASDQSCFLVGPNGCQRTCRNRLNVNASSRRGTLQAYRCVRSHSYALHRRPMGRSTS